MRKRGNTAGTLRKIEIEDSKQNEIVENEMENNSSKFNGTESDKTKTTSKFN